LKECALVSASAILSSPFKQLLLSKQGASIFLFSDYSYNRELELCLRTKITIGKSIDDGIAL